MDPNYALVPDDERLNYSEYKVRLGSLDDQMDEVRAEINLVKNELSGDNLSETRRTELNASLQLLWAQRGEVIHNTGLLMQQFLSSVGTHVQPLFVILKHLCT